MHLATRSNVRVVYLPKNKTKKKGSMKKKNSFVKLCARK